MQAWKGWTSAAAPAVISAPTWDEWCAYRRGIPRGEQRQQASPHEQESPPFSDRELAHLSFVRWLYQRGHFGPADIDHD